MMLLDDTTIQHSDGVYAAILLLCGFMFVFPVLAPLVSLFPHVHLALHKIHSGHCICHSVVLCFLSGR